mmetsp:Transcript_37584/g.70157  ORF Transcript_37584/g.70157 Transcript_37584/m.70157 type:complete len:770 (+) Transcript_37584:58-2367(+)
MSFIESSFPPNLPKLLGPARTSTAPARRVSRGSGDHFWSLNSQDPFVKPGRGGRGTPRPSRCGNEDQGSIAESTPSQAAERPGVSHLMERIEKELQIQGLMHSPPNLDRVRVFASAFSEVIDKLPSYRGLLLAVQKEYDGLIAKLHAESIASAPLEGRLKTMKAESLTFVSESMAWFQMEISELRKQKLTMEAEIEVLREDKKTLSNESLRFQECSRQDNYMAKEMHAANVDILKHMDRMEKQVELLRKQEKEALSQMNILQQRVKEKDNRISTVEEQLKSERAKCAAMVPREEFEALREELRQMEQAYKDLEENYQAKQRDYMSIVEAYTKISGQGLDEIAAGEARPLTPRPNWFHCRGLLDPETSNSVSKAEVSQDLLQHMLVCSRTLLSAYGLATAANKSSVFGGHARHQLALPLATSPAEGVLHVRKHESGGLAEEDDPNAAPTDAAQKKSLASLMKDSDEWLPADIEPETPMIFKHSERVRNLRFSRKKAADFIEGLLTLRSPRHSYGATASGGSLARPFVEFMQEHVPEEVKEDETKLFLINMYATLRRYAAEPDFMAYLLLVLGKISDAVVRDNKRLCSELLKIFTNHFESSDGTRNITKQKFFYGLREVLPNKEKEMWQDLVTYFPAGGPEIMVNYEWLLFDDMYILSPIIYALRLQHLEEVLALQARLEKVVRQAADEKSSTVNYDAVETAFHDDAEFSLIQAEDIARAFDVHVTDLKSDTVRDVEQFLAMLKHGEIFHIIFFPALASDDADLAAQEEMP